MLVVGQGVTMGAVADEFRSCGDLVVVASSAAVCPSPVERFDVACLGLGLAPARAGDPVAMRAAEELLQLAGDLASVMTAGAGGSIVTLSTLGSAAAPLDPLPAAAAAALRTGSVAVATSVGKAGVRVNALAVDPSIEVGRRPSRTLLPRAGSPVDVARVATFLASDDAAFITGIVLRVDGGLLAHLPHSTERELTDG